MLSIIIVILGVSFMLYALLGGADFGAGIVETFAGRKGEKVISKAIAPVWEANHVWLILAIVILFTGFPRVYSVISTALHIPLMVVLIGIVLRGSSFTFRHYDVSRDESHKYFTLFFKISSFITPFFLGITLGAMILGNISTEGHGGFYDQFIYPWLNVFCIAMGLFTTALFGYIAAVFVIGETLEKKKYTRIARLFLFITIIMAVLVFAAAELEGHHLLDEFLASAVSIGSLSIVMVFIPVVLYLLRNPSVPYLRVAVGIQVSLIMLGWFAIQFPILVYDRTGNHLTFYNTQAPQATLTQLLIALFVGLVLIIPSFYFLFKVFKRAN